MKPAQRPLLYAFPFISFCLSLFLGLIMSDFAKATDNTTPAREHARCEANYNLCMDVAETDFNACLNDGQSQSHCQSDRNEDESSCSQGKTNCDSNVANAVNCVNGTASLPDVRLVGIQYSVQNGTSVFTATAINDGASFQKEFIFELRVVGLYVARRHLKGLKTGETVALSTRLPLGTILKDYRVTSNVDTKAAVRECNRNNNTQRLTNYLKSSH